MHPTQYDGLRPKLDLNQRYKSYRLAGIGAPVATDHGTLTGLEDDDHTHYVLNDGSRGSYVGESTIVTVGTVATGTWEATDVAVAHGGTGASSAAAARTNLGISIGSDVQAYDADLQQITTLATTDGNFIVGNGGTWVAESGATVRTSLGLSIGTDVQAYDAELAAIAALSTTDGNIIVGNGSTWVAENGATARTSLGLTIGTDVNAQMDTVGQAEAEAGTATTRRAWTAERVKQAIAALGGGGGGGAVGANVVINGEMMIAQRGTSAVTTDGAYPVDRFQQNMTGAGLISSQQSSTVPAGYKNSLDASVNSADLAKTSSDDYSLSYAVEGYDVAHLGFGGSDAQQVTLTFQVRSSETGTFCVSFRNEAKNRSYVAEYSISSADTWEEKTVTLTGDTSGTWDSDNTTGLIITWDLGSGSDFNATAGSWTGSDKTNTTNQVDWIGTSSATFYLTGVKLESGSSSTAFPHDSYKDVLSHCQRYYYATPSTVRIMSQGHSGNGRAFGQTFVFPTEMRDTPTMTESNISYYSGCSSLSDQIANRGTVAYQAVGAINGNHGVTFEFQADAEL